MNQTVDTMGFTNALNSCFTIHELNHAYYAANSNGKRWVATAESDGVIDWRNAPPVETSNKYEVGGSAAS